MRPGGLDDLLHGEIEAIVVDRAADAAARELDHLLHRREPGDHAPVDPDLADLVHDHGDRLAAQPVVQHVPEQRGLPAAQEARQDVDGDGVHARG
jgi:hypothetical protein